MRLILCLFLILSACAKHGGNTGPECSGPDLSMQQVTWPDGTSRKSDVYHCNNGEDLIYDNADASHSFWRVR